jgi:hypothetical protein
LSKKTVEQIVHQQQHYLIALKANQPTLYKTVVHLQQTGTPLTQVQTFDSSHNRQVYRQVWVYEAPAHLQSHWANLKCLIWVERHGVRQGKPFHEQQGYISDLALEATEFAQRIQQHWGIENRLHWVRDVTFDEDHARPGGYAPVVWAILNCFLITLVRRLGCRTVPQGARKLANQVKRVFEFLTQGFSPPK